MQATHKPQPANPMRQQRGFTLLEVLVSVLILVIGVLGAAGMTITGARNTAQSGIRSSAIALGNEAAELLRAHPDQAQLFVGVNTTGAAGIPDTTCYAPGCAESAMVNNDLFEWADRIKSRLPGGNAVICEDTVNGASTPAAPACAGTGTLVVKIWWNERFSNGAIAPTTRAQAVIPICQLATGWTLLPVGSQICV